MQKIRSILIYFIAINLIVLGIDKFAKFIPESCTLMDSASPTLLYVIGVIEIILAFLLFMRKGTRTILLLIFLLMAWAVGMHMKAGTDDIGGAVFLGGISLLPFVLDKISKK